MPFPNFSGKHAHDPLVTPARFIEFMRSRGLYGKGSPPESIILTFQGSLVRELKAEGRIAGEAPLDRAVYPLQGASVGVVHVGIGAPALAITVEELVELGARRFVIVGTAGTLQRDINVGDAVLCTGAVRDEGVSHHYVDDGHQARPSDHLLALLRDGLRAAGIQFHEGSSWTIDTPYRETIEEARHYRDARVMTVEMEASALFTVAAHRKVDAAAMFAISDLLGELEWAPSFGSEDTKRTQMRLFDVAVATLAEQGS